MKTKAQKWGNSLAVRVPKGIAEQAGVAVNDTLDIEVAEGGVILLKPRRRQKYRLIDLLKGMTRENMPTESDFGRPRGLVMAAAYVPERGDIVWLTFDP